MNGNVNAKNIHIVVLSRAYITVEYFLQNQQKITFVLAHAMTWQVKEIRKYFQNVPSILLIKYHALLGRKKQKAEKLQDTNST